MSSCLHPCGILDSPSLPGPGATQQRAGSLGPCLGAPPGPLGRTADAHPTPMAPRGFFQAGPALHLIEPLNAAGEAGPHKLYQLEHLHQGPGTCGVSDNSLASILGPRTSAAFRSKVSGSPRVLLCPRVAPQLFVRAVSPQQAFEQSPG